MASVPLKNRTIWVTGASSGIGKTLAEKLIRAGNHVIVTARSEPKLLQLKQLSPDSVSVVAADIADPDCVTALASALAEVTDHVDTAILNAGTCEYVDVEHFDSAVVERVFQVNLLGMSRSIEAVLPLLKASRSAPHLVGISSASAITGLPRAEAYGSSKAAVVSFLESLGLDLERFGIAVSIVYPGFVDTPLTRRNDFPMPFIMNSDEAVRRIIDGIEKRKLKLSFPAPLIFGLKLMALAPEKVRFWFGQKMVRQSKPSTG